MRWGFCAPSVRSCAWTGCCSKPATFTSLRLTTQVHLRVPFRLEDRHHRQGEQAFCLPSTVLCYTITQSQLSVELATYSVTACVFGFMTRRRSSMATKPNKS